MKNNTRNSNIELLRILCMFFIIMHHSFVYSNVEGQMGNMNSTLFYILQIFGKLSNNIFIIITGYYMINKNIKKKNIIRLILEILFYSYSFLILYLILDKERNIIIILSSLIPISSNVQWFVTAYLLLYFSIPFINIVVKNINKKEFLGILAFLFICFSYLPTGFLLKEYESNYIWFIFMYLIGGYLSLYGKNSKKMKYNKVILPISIALLVGLLLVKQHYKIAIIDIYDITNPLMLLPAISITIAFINKKEWHNRLVNYIASSVLGIYLIHENIIIKPILWKKVNIASYINYSCFWIYEIAVILSIFLVCFIIDKARERLLEENIMKYIEKKFFK